MDSDKDGETISPLFGKDNTSSTATKTARSALVALHDAICDLLAENERLRAISGRSNAGGDFLMNSADLMMSMPSIKKSIKSGETPTGMQRVALPWSAIGSEGRSPRSPRPGEPRENGFHMADGPLEVSNVRGGSQINGWATDDQEDFEDPLDRAMRMAMETADGVATNMELVDLKLPSERMNDIQEDDQHDIDKMAQKQRDILEDGLATSDVLPVILDDEPVFASVRGSEPGMQDDSMEATMSAEAPEMSWVSEETQRSCQFAISPVGKFRLSWDVTWIALLLAEIWATPFRVFFLVDNAESDSLIYMSYAITSFFFADVVLNFFTGYLEVKSEKICYNNLYIAKKYLKFWFWVDVLVTIPYDELFSSDESGTVAVLRATRAQKALRLLRIVKIFRILKLLKYVKVFAHVRKETQRQRITNMSTGEKLDETESDHMESRESRPCGALLFLAATTSIVERVIMVLRMFSYPICVFVVLMLLAHAHACAWRICLPLGLATNMETALDDYYRCFCWAYTTLILGFYEWTYTDMTNDLWLVYMVLLSERLLLGAFMIVVLVFWGFLKGQADTGVTLRLTDALHYMASHSVSVQTQLQVLASIQETTTARVRHRHFNNLVNQDLPSELQHMIRKELWTYELKSLGLLEVVFSWTDTMLGDLAQVVREEVYASSVYVFKEGDASSIAYKVLSGELLVTSTTTPEGVPPFYESMWVGEKALINASLKRSGSLHTVKMSHLLAVPGDAFRELLTKEDLLQVFNDFCAEHLWRGLCGRCGVLGDHFSHECPHLNVKRPSQKGASQKQGWLGTKKSSKKKKMARDLRMFLEDNDILPVGQILVGIGIASLDQLQDFNWDDLQPGYKDISENDCRELQAYQELLEPAAILTFRAERTGMMRTMLDTMTDSDHFLFLSHYKLEAGTEASLMRTELHQLIREDMTWAHVGSALQTPVFLDSEDLTSLEDLQVRVRKSHNLLLMLTKNVLSRPWVLLEIVTALESGVQVLLVEVEKIGNNFVFPDEKFYTHLLDGTLLGKTGVELIAKYGVSMETVADSVRQVFEHIALHYSPHRPAEIRRCELQAILKQCVFNDRQNEPVTSLDKPHRNRSESLIEPCGSGTASMSRRRPSKLSNGLAEYEKPVGGRAGPSRMSMHSIPAMSKHREQGSAKVIRRPAEETGTEDVGGVPRYLRGSVDSTKYETHLRSENRRHSNSASSSTSSSIDSSPVAGAETVMQV